jgi:hypothetical protein
VLDDRAEVTWLFSALKTGKVSKLVKASAVFFNGILLFLKAN